MGERSYRGAREIGGVWLRAFLLGLGWHGEHQPSAAGRLDAYVRQGERLGLAASEQRIAHDADDRNVEPAATPVLGLPLEVSAAAAPGVQGRGLNGFYYRFR